MANGSSKKLVWETEPVPDRPGRRLTCWRNGDVAIVGYEFLHSQTGNWTRSTDSCDIPWEDAVEMARAMVESAGGQGMKAHCWHRDCLKHPCHDPGTPMSPDVECFSPGGYVCVDDTGEARMDCANSVACYGCEKCKPPDDSQEGES